MYKDISGLFFFFFLYSSLNHWTLDFYFLHDCRLRPRRPTVVWKTQKGILENLAKARQGLQGRWLMCLAQPNLKNALSFLPYILAKPLFMTRRPTISVIWPIDFVNSDMTIYLLKSLLWLWSSSYEGPHPTNLDIHWVISHQFGFNPGPSDKCSWCCRHVICGCSFLIF